MARWQRLKWKSRSFLKKLGERILLWSTCGYGEKPERVFIWAAGIITLSALIYFINGNIISVDNNDVFGLSDSFYLSVVTFVTLGFGGPWYPDPESWIKYVVMAEGFIGAFFIALFVMTFGRRMMR